VRRSRPSVDPRLGVVDNPAVLISDDKEFVFVHVPKTGGSSVGAALQPLCSLRNRGRLSAWLRPLGLPRDYHGFRFRRHDPLSVAEGVMPAQRFVRFFKFAFVRNPWDRLVSEYNSVLRLPGHRRHARVRAMGGFKAYLRREAPFVLASQRRLLVDKTGRIGADFVGRFEQIEQDFGSVCARLGIEAALPHLNRHEHGDYRSYYDDESRELVRSHWGEDVVAFDYEF
jgi:hypothetical protein